MGDVCGTLPIKIDQGAKFELPITYLDADQEPIDLTDYTAKMQIRVAAGADEAIITLTTDPDGGIVIDGPNGKITVSIPATETADFSAPWEGFYDLKVIPPNAPEDAERVLQGSVCISPAVTV